MDPVSTFQVMRGSDTFVEDRRQAACDLYNWLSRGGFPVNGWSVAQCKAECKRYMS